MWMLIQVNSGTNCFCLDRESSQLLGSDDPLSRLVPGTGRNGVVYRIEQVCRTRGPLPVARRAVHILAAIRERQNLPATALPTRTRLRLKDGHLTTNLPYLTRFTSARRKQ